MEETHLGSSNQKKYMKGEEMTTSKSKSKFSSFSCVKNLLNLLACFGNIFVFLFNKIALCFSRCSILVQFSFFLIPISIAMIIAIFIIHFNFYSNLYAFNFSKAFKEEFLDLYITTIDDLKSELNAIVVKETKLDLENHLFFQVYFKELSSIGFMDQSTYILKDITDNEGSHTIYSDLNKVENVDVNFTIDENIASDEMDLQYYNTVGQLAKLYYYMFPHIWYESFQMKSIINQSFFLAYQFRTNRYRSIRKKIFFRFPKNTDGFTIYNNFVASNYLLNPQVEDHLISDSFDIEYKIDNFYLDLNWFTPIDYEFRRNINYYDDYFLTKINLAHLNVESDGSINKTFISYSQEYIQHDDRLFIINIFFYTGQNNLKEGDNDYSFYIIKDNLSGDNYYNVLDEEEEELTYRYSDNVSYLVSYSDMTEYSISNMDFRFFHLGLYDNHYNFYMNGVFFDTFNLDYFYDYTQFYSAAKEGDNDLKYYAALYLYKSLFQKVKYTKLQKTREEILLYHFKDEEKVKQICEKIDFDSYRSYLENVNIDCWETRNRIYYNTEKFMYVTMDNDSNTIDPVYPYCGCLPLYCLKNFEDLDKDLNNLELADEINLPNKCQNKFMNYESSLSETDTENEYTGDNKILELIDNSLDPINFDYIKILPLNLNQLPGYFFLVISQIKTIGEVYIHSYYKLITKIEIIVLVLGVLIITSILSIIIIYKNMKKYSLVISKFKKKFEFFVFHSENEDESNSKNTNNLNKFMRVKEDKKIESQIINNDNIQILETDSLISKDVFNINDNNLLDDLFLIFTETYNISRKDIENFYSSKDHKSKNQMKIEMMQGKNELFELLSIYCLNAPFFQLNLNFDYNMYEYSQIMKKYNHYARQIESINKEQTRLTQNILYELISTECIVDYGLIPNFNFKYITNIKTKEKKNLKEEFKKVEVDVKKLVLKRKNILIDTLKNNFESDDFLNYNKLESAFNFFLVNSYHKYFRQIALENIIP